LPGLVEDYLRYLPSLVAYRPIIREYEEVWPPGKKLVRLREMSFRFLSEEEELEEKRRAAKGERSERYRGIYASLGLSVVAHSLSPSRRRARRKR
jgi:hypothetical protein